MPVLWRHPPAAMMSPPDFTCEAQLCAETHIPFLDWTELQFQNPLLFLVSLPRSLMFQRSVLPLCFQDVNIIDTLNSKHTLFAKSFPLKTLTVIRWAVCF